MDMFKWVDIIYKSSGIRRIAENKGYDSEDLQQELIEWLWLNQDIANNAIEPERYIRRSITNKAKDIVNQWATKLYQRDNVIYPREFIKANKNIVFGIYQADSYAHAIQCDMLLALDSLNERQRDAFFTTKDDDSEDELQRRRDAAMRSKAEKLVWWNMNNYAHVRGVAA